MITNVRVCATSCPAKHTRSQPPCVNRLVARAWQPFAERSAQSDAAVLVGLMASCVILGAAPVQAEVAAEIIAGPAFNMELSIVKEDQRGAAEFALRQQENVKKAAITEQRQRLASEAARAEAEIAMKLMEHKANVEGAKQKGDQQAAESSEAAVEKLKHQQQELAKAAAEISTHLDRQELLEHAKFVANKQALERSLGSGTTDLRLHKWLVSIGHPAVR